MRHIGDSRLRQCLLEDWQRDFPLCERPFEVIAERSGTHEADVIDLLRELQSDGVITRVGGVVRPNTLGASTLAALAAPPHQVDAIATRLAAERGLNHVYLRENDWNLWFVVTGPERDFVTGTLDRIARSTGLDVLDLRLERSFHIDLGFPLSGRRDREPRKADRAVVASWRPSAGDPDLVQAMTEGLPLVPRPFEAIGARLGRSASDVIARLDALASAAILSRIGVIVRHRALGWRSNAMVVWDVAPDDVERAGMALAGCRSVNLCYRRTSHRAWPYNLYCMIHAKQRSDALAMIADAEALAGIEGRPRQVLFSLRCFKQTGAMLAYPKEAA